MRKLFAFVMAMVITAMVYGQYDDLVYPIDQPVDDPQYRTEWVGGTDSYHYYFVLQENQKFAMRLPAAGALPAGENLSITQVAFRWQESADGSDFDPHFRVLIYAGGNSEWIQEGHNVSRTTDTTVQGTLLYSQNCVAEGYGWQIVELNQAVALPADQEIWIAVQALGRSCCHLDVDFDKQHPEWWGQHLLFGYSTEDPIGYYWKTADFRSGNETRVPGRFALMALVDNGEPYINTVDWDVDMYSLETADNQGNITRLYVDEFMMMDSLYLVPALWNLGPDNNTSDGRVHLYIESAGIDFINDNLSEIYDISVGPEQGWVFNWLGGLMAFSDMGQMGLSFPFVVCMTYESYGRDPNPSNNQACVMVTDQEEDPDVLVNSNELNILNISPNPANTYIKVENAAGSQITVYNVTGQEVLSVASAEANETLNISELNAGLYIVRVANGDEVTTAKVSIVR